MVRAITKVLAWLVAGLLGISVLFYLLLLVINWQDEEPSPTVKYFSKVRAQRPKVADERNAFIYLVGMEADAQHDPLQVGLAMIANERRRLPQQDSAGYSHPDYPKSNAVKISAKPLLDLLDVCQTIGSACLSFLDNKADTVTFGPSEQLLLERYRKLITFPEWSENDVTLNGPIPPYSTALNGQKVALFDCWRKSDSYGAKYVNELLEADAHFWRGVFDASDSLITSMIAASAMKRNILWTNLIMHRAVNHRSHIEIPATWLRPISGDERIMERTWIGEWTFSKSLLRVAKQGGFHTLDAVGGGSSFIENMEDWLMRPLFQPQDTINRRADYFVTLMRYYQVPYEQVPQVEARLTNLSQGFGGEGMTFPQMFYNPIGKILNEIDKPSYSGYMLKIADLEGGRRVLLATCKLREAHTTPDKVGEALKNISWTNPYTKQPFVWDAASESVFFDGIGGKQSHYLFPL